MKAFRTLFLLIIALMLLTSCAAVRDAINDQLGEFASELGELASELSDPDTTAKSTPSATPESTVPPTTDDPEETEPEKTQTPDGRIAEDGVYTSKEDVALYIHQYGHLPSNFITKKEAEALGWTSGGLDRYAYGKSIGGDRFGNYEKILPTKKGRTYTECDIDTLHADKRGAKRIVFSNDGLIYYTEDHYETFTKLYGEDS